MARSRPTKLVGPLYSRPIPTVGGTPTIIPTAVISNVPMRRRRTPTGITERVTPASPPKVSS